MKQERPSLPLGWLLIATPFGTAEALDDELGNEGTAALTFDVVPLAVTGVVGLRGCRGS